MQQPVTREEKIELKNKLKAFCHRSIQERISMAKQSMEAAQEAANGEEKSSAGDKYETSRAMGHLQKDMQARQMGEYMKELASLHSVYVDQVYDRVEAGSVVRCRNGDFFLGAGLGKQMIENCFLVFLSYKAPLAGCMMHKKKGDTFMFNGNAITITDIF